MKKILLAVMAVAAIGFTSCGNKTQQAEATDSTEVAINAEEEANAVIDNLKAFVAAGDAEKVSAALRSRRCHDLRYHRTELSEGEC